MACKKLRPYFFNFASPTPLTLPNSPNVVGRKLARSISTVSGKIRYGRSPAFSAKRLRCCRKCSNKPPDPELDFPRNVVDVDLLVRDGTDTCCLISSTSLWPAKTSSAPAVKDNTGYLPVELRK